MEKVKEFLKYAKKQWQTLPIDSAVMPSIDSSKNWKDDIHFNAKCNCCICKSNFIADNGRVMCYECYSDDVS